MPLDQPMDSVLDAGGGKPPSQVTVAVLESNNVSTAELQTSNKSTVSLPSNNVSQVLIA